MNEDLDLIRAEMQREINATATVRAELEGRHGQVWNTAELMAEFEVLGFAAPFVVVRRKSDGAKGSLCFQHGPRFYFDWTQDK